MHTKAQKDIYFYFFVLVYQALHIIFTMSNFETQIEAAGRGLLPRFPPQQQVHELVLHRRGRVLLLNAMEKVAFVLNYKHTYSQLQKHSPLALP